MDLDDETVWIVEVDTQDTGVTYCSAELKGCVRFLLHERIVIDAARKNMEIRYGKKPDGQRWLWPLGFGTIGKPYISKLVLGVHGTVHAYTLALHVILHSPARMSMLLLGPSQLPVLGFRSCRTQKLRSRYTACVAFYEL